MRAERLFDAARHVPLRPLSWRPDEARAAIDDIVDDAVDHLDPQHFWPAHPLDEIGDGHTSFYAGATGMVWALDYLARSGATRRTIDPCPIVPNLLAASKAEFTSATYGEYAAHGSFLFGDMAAALVAMRLAPSSAIADTVFERARANNDLPVRELMWGLPGSMLACIQMAAITREPRWRALWAGQASRLLEDLQETESGPLWEQDLYGRRQCYLGPVHGFAGNMIPLLCGWEWLSDNQRARVADAVVRTLSLTAGRSADGINWPPVVAPPVRPLLCQHCHGAPGMVTAFAGVPFASPELDALLLEGGRLVWTAGPLGKGHGLCHGTAGNGYAFLKLYHRTGDPIWLERARSFAMMAIAQYREARAQHGRGRYSLWTGDVGSAIYLWDCVTAEARFPTIDVF